MSARILVIEDDPASLDLMTYLLTAHGFGLLTATCGDRGLALARQQLPDLIICDIQLPGMDGYAVAAAVKADAALHATPIMAVSAMAMVGDRERGLAAGFDAYVSKPIEPEIFVSQLHPLLKPEHRPVPNVPSPLQPTIQVSERDRGTLLVIDDTEVNLELKSSIFEPLGYEVLRADSVALGLQLARAHAPTLIISDLSLPGAGGFELLRALKSDPDLSAIPVIIISATYLCQEVRAQALALGAARFLARPMDAEQVVCEVEDCLAAVRGGPRGVHPGH